jgi:hypothetical protein
MGEYLVLIKILNNKSRQILSRIRKAFKFRVWCQHRACKSGPYDVLFLLFQSEESLERLACQVGRAGLLGSTPFPQLLTSLLPLKYQRFARQLTLPTDCE